MNMLRSILATAGFEFRRSLTVQRISVSLVLMLFPPTMVTIVLLILSARNATDVFPVEFFVIGLVSLICLLSLLLWATPNVYSELEGKSWIFLASRPGGRLSIFLGKYLTAVLSSFFVAGMATTLCIFIADRFTPFEDALHMWLVLCAIFLLASFGYGAVFSMIGTLLYKRAMVFAVAYVIAWEAILASFPAIINRFSIRFHLQSLGVEWLGDFFPPWFFDNELRYADVYGEPSAPFHLICIAAWVTVCLGIGCYVIVTRQYITSDET